MIFCKLNIRGWAGLDSSSLDTAHNASTKSTTEMKQKRRRKRRIDEDITGVAELTNGVSIKSCWSCKDPIHSYYNTLVTSALGIWEGSHNIKTGQSDSTIYTTLSKMKQWLEIQNAHTTIVLPCFIWLIYSKCANWIAQQIWVKILLHKLYHKMCKCTQILTAHVNDSSIACCS